MNSKDVDALLDFFAAQEIAYAVLVTLLHRSGSIDGTDLARTLRIQQTEGEFVKGRLDRLAELVDFYIENAVPRTLGEVPRD